MFRDMDEIKQCFSFYKTKLSPYLTREQKESLMRRIYDYRCEHDPLGDENPKSDFPELEKCWPKDYVSGLELVILQDLLDKNRRE
jgi:hypothetical protein